jgi:hypothetical protein
MLPLANNFVENLLFAGMLALIYTIAMLICPYILILVAANLMYRLAAGRYFRWLSWRTIAPLCALLVGGWGIFFYALLTEPVFLITH